MFIGCSIGDFGTIFYFQNIEHTLLTWQVMSLAIVNGLLTSILLETFILSRQMVLKEAFKVAIGMSFISMISNGSFDEFNRCYFNRRRYVNLVGYSNYVVYWIYNSLPYNYYRLKKWGYGCH